MTVLRKTVLITLFISILAWTNSKNGNQEQIKQRSSYIERVKKQDLPGEQETLRDIYVSKLAGMLSGKEDREVVQLFLNLVEKDNNEWVRLEAVADMKYLRIPNDMKSKIYSALEKVRKDERINFKLLASSSLIDLKKGEGVVDTSVLNTLIWIAKGEGIKTWKVMIPPHNVGMFVKDPETKLQIPFEDSFKRTMRLHAIDALNQSNDEVSKAVIKGLENDEEALVREKAKMANNPD